MGASDALVALAQHVHARVDWTEFRIYATHPAVVTFLSLASQAAFIADTQALHQPMLGELFDAGAGQAGLADRPDLETAAQLGAHSLNQHELWHDVLTQAKRLLPQLRELRVLR